VRQCAPMPTILIVDDAPAILELLRAVFRGAGYEVLTAHDAESAIRLACESHFDVVLSDVNMPRMTGCDLARWVAEHSPATRMALMSGCEAACAECPYVPRCTLIRKPFRFQELVEVVERSLQRGTSKSATDQ